MHRHNKPEKAAVPPLASRRLFDQVRERMPCIDYSLNADTEYHHWMHFQKFSGIKLHILRPIKLKSVKPPPPEPHSSNPEYSSLVFMYRAGKNLRH
jgi:hypothetical protein